jgi:recombination associated protein RdgC
VAAFYSRGADFVFKNLTIFDIADPALLRFDAIETALRQAAFTHASAQQSKSVGWVAPRGGEHDPFLENIGGHWLASFVIETRSVPGSAVSSRVQAMMQKLEEDAGRKPSRRELKQMKEAALMELMPKSFPKSVNISVWINPIDGFLCIDAATESRVDDAVTALIKAIDQLQIKEAHWSVAPEVAMREWLLSDDHSLKHIGLSLGEACVLREQAAGKAMARFSNQNLACEEVRQNLYSGKMPLSLELCAADRLVFSLQANGRLKGIHINASQASEDGQRGTRDLDSDFTILVGELKTVLSSLRAETDQMALRMSVADEASRTAIKSIATMWDVREAGSMVE